MKRSASWRSGARVCVCVCFPAREVDLGQIRKDLPRTFAEHSEVHRAAADIEAVLVDYSILDPAIGYCQGMNCIAAVVVTRLRPDMVASKAGPMLTKLDQTPAKFGPSSSTLGRIRAASSLHSARLQTTAAKFGDVDLVWADIDPIRSRLTLVEPKLIELGPSLR